MSNSRSNENQPGADCHPNLGSNSSSVIENLEDNFAASLEFKDKFPGSLELSDRGPIDSFAETSDQEKGRDALYNICSGSQSTMDCPCHFSVPKDAVGCADVQCIHSDHMTDSCCPDKKNKPVDDMNVDDSLEFSDGEIRWSDVESLSDLEEYLSRPIYCAICGENDHVQTCCPYLESVPLDANISSSFEVVCRYCLSRIGKELFCSSCDRRVIGFAVQKHCAVCDMYNEHSMFDCPYANKPELLGPSKYMTPIPSEFVTGALQPGM